MKFTTSSPEGMTLAERVVSCVTLAFDDLHERTQDRWAALAPTRPHIMNAVILDELKQEFAEDNSVNTLVNNQLRTFCVTNDGLIFRVKKQKNGRLKVASNDTSRDAEWGLNVSQLSLPQFDLESFERLVLSYEVSRNWQTLKSVAFMEFQYSECVALERLSLIADLSGDLGQDEPDNVERFRPSIYRINKDEIDRVSQPGLTIEDEHEMES